MICWSTSCGVDKLIIVKSDITNSCPLLISNLVLPTHRQNCQEFPTGILLTQEIERTKQNISMLVLNNKASFTKKATGRINFTCNQGEEARKTIEKLITTGEPQTVWLDSVGINESGQQVSSFSFEWTLLLKN